MTPTYRLGDRADIVGLLPYALGFHPSDSLVMVGLAGKRISLYARDDLHDRPDETVASFLRLTRRTRDVTAVVLVAYGPAQAAVAHTRAVCAELETRGLRVADAIRVDGGRYHCLLCDDCTPADGVAFEASGTVGAAVGAYEGMVPLPDRDAVTRQVRPWGGLARIAMDRATERAQARLGTLLSGVDDPSATLVEAGRAAVDAVLAAGSQGRRVTDDDVAWLSVLLHDIRCRDHAWIHSDRAQVALWLDATRRADPPLAAPIATLLGWCAWRDGQTVLAEAALDRAHRVDPDYSLARLLLDAVRDGIPPSVADGWAPGGTARRRGTSPSGRAGRPRQGDPPGRGARRRRRRRDIG